MSDSLKLLIGKTIEGGWTIISQQQPRPTATGGCSSHGFIARNAAGQEVFIKILDIRLSPTHPIKRLMELCRPGPRKDLPL